MATFLTSLFICLMFTAMILVFWLYWGEGSAENVRRWQDEERERCCQEALRRRETGQ